MDLFREQQRFHHTDRCLWSLNQIWKGVLGVWGAAAPRNHTTCRFKLIWRRMMDLYLVFKQSKSICCYEVNYFCISSLLLAQMNGVEEYMISWYNLYFNTWDIIQCMIQYKIQELNLHSTILSKNNDTLYIALSANLLS